MLGVIFLYKVCDIGAGEAAERRADSKSDWLWGIFTDAPVNFLQRLWSNLTEPLEQCSGAAVATLQDSWRKFTGCFRFSGKISVKTRKLPMCWLKAF